MAASAKLNTAPDVPLDAIEWRIQTINNGWYATVVAYLDAPTVAAALDAWVGPANWRDHYEMSAGGRAMWCHLSVRDPATGEWVTKEDVGTPSNMEAEKGLVSDAFKRVASRKWGVGRNVYSLPVLSLHRNKYDSYGDNNKKAGRLNDASLAEIKRQLEAQGHKAAAERVRVGNDEPTDDVTELTADDSKNRKTTDAAQGSLGDTIREEHGQPPAKATSKQVQALAAACRDAGLDDDDRHLIADLVSAGRTQSTKELYRVEVDHAFAVVGLIRYGKRQLVADGPGGEPALLKSDGAVVDVPFPDLPAVQAWIAKAQPEGGAA